MYIYIYICIYRKGRKIGINEKRKGKRGKIMAECEL